MKHTILAIGLVLAATAGAAAEGNPAATAARQWREKHERAIVDEYFSLLAVPNVARDRENIQRNADMLVSMMERRGIAARLVTVPGANPVVFGEMRSPGAKRTLVFYAHYDGQPLDPKEWSTPPFSPVLKSAGADAKNAKVIALPPPGVPFDPESRIYARSVADDKAPIIALLTAIDAIRAAGLSLKSNIKFAFEGEEEAGSPNFARILEANKQLFSGDVWLGLDGPVHQSRRQ
jgi:acetylornithine deacetylase/succinyl-diaminopimelate desuccinylase-like protein